MRFKVYCALLFSGFFSLIYMKYSISDTIDRIPYEPARLKIADSLTSKSNGFYGSGYYPDPDGDIDIVYTWVNGSDPRFVRDMNLYLRQINGPVNSDISQTRYNDKEELRYSLRSIEKYAPWCRKVFVVTNGQIPYWLNLSNEKVQIVTHEQIFENSEDALPTFSSNAIEVNLHRIPGLAKQFIYLNDDVMFGAPVERRDFISDEGQFIVYLGDKLNKCAAKCYWNMVANGHCDAMCNNVECQFDGGDCAEIATKEIGTRRINRAVKTVETYIEALKTTNHVLNNRYGFKQRYSAAHGPLMFDVNIMNEMQKVFGNLTSETRTHKIRQVNDSQMAMLYDYFLMEEPVGIEDVFEHFDSDHSGVWEENEWSAMQVPVQDLLTSCYNETQVNLTILNQCQPLVEAVMYEYGSRNKYNYIVKQATSNLIQFVMLRSSLPQVKRELSRIKSYPKKFICINDNLSFGAKTENKRVLEYLREFYNGMFPMRSNFELPDNTVNEFLHVN